MVSGLEGRRRTVLRHPRLLGGVSVLLMVLGALILFLTRVPTSDPVPLATVIDGSGATGPTSIG